MLLENVTYKRLSVDIWVVTVITFLDSKTLGGRDLVDDISFLLSILPKRFIYDNTEQQENIPWRWDTWINELEFLYFLYKVSSSTLKRESVSRII